LQEYSSSYCFYPTGLKLPLPQTKVNCNSPKVDPARSTAPAVFVGGWAIAQLWMLWGALIIGSASGGGIYRFLFFVV
jgi:glycerol uptake facilitator-like aquaporin